MPLQGDAPWFVNLPVREGGEVHGAQTSIAALKNDVSVAIRYLASWLSGQGAVAIYGLMEDAATAEIARSQIWQWIHGYVVVDDGEKVTRELVENLIAEEVALMDSDKYVVTAGEILREVSLFEALPEFLTTVAYEQLENF